MSSYFLCLIYRKPNPRFFSIEKVFREVSEGLAKLVDLRSVYAENYSSSLTGIVRNIRKLRKEKADIYHVTGDIHYAALAFPRRKTVLTIHDCVFLYKYKGAKQKLINFLFLKLPVRHCRFVTTISEKSRAEIIQNSGCRPEKVIVIPNPVSTVIYFQEKPFNEHKPVLLFIGTTPNKNLERVAEALSGLNCALRIIGVVPMLSKRVLADYNIEFSSTTGLSEKDLAFEYASADIILFPSLYEGFGLPVIEGQKAGRPVITSNISPMKEVAGKGACLVNPHDVQSIRKGVTELIDNKKYREELVNKGFENVRQYTRENIASLYKNLYDSMRP